MKKWHKGLLGVAGFWFIIWMLMVHTELMAGLLLLAIMVAVSGGIFFACGGYDD